MKKILISVALLVAFVVVSIVANVVLRLLGVEPSWVRVLLQTAAASPLIYLGIRVWEGSER